MKPFQYPAYFRKRDSRRSILEQSKHRGRTWAGLPLFFVRPRSFRKSAYLWQRGNRWAGAHYYYYRVRSAKCLDLWSCGHQLREPFATCKRLHRKILY
jgi:hypothetical protein